MFSLMDDNIHNIAVEGVFDDCRDMVKAVSNDLDFKRKYKIGTVNSINWARLLAQVVYYFAGYIQATTSNDQQVRLHRAQRQLRQRVRGPCSPHDGLPVAQLVVAANENDVLDEFFPHRRVPGCAAVPIRTKHPTVDGHFQGQQFQSVSCSICWAAMLPAQPTCSGRNWLGRALRPERRPGVCPGCVTRYGFVSGKARTPTAWTPSATATNGLARPSTPTRRWREGGA